MFKFLIATSFIGLIAASPAFAGDWDGFYVGASIGGGTTNVDLNFTTIGRSTDTFNGETERSSDSDQGRASGNGSGAVVDGFAGINALYGRLLVGGQLEASLTNQEFNSGVNVINTDDDGDVAQFSQNVEIHSNWALSAIGRIGFLVSDATLLYGLAGFTYAQFEMEELFPFGGYTYEEDGFAVGGGIEHKFSQRVSIRGEYRFVDFDTHDLHAQSTSIFDDADGDRDVNVRHGQAAIDADTHVVRAAVVLSLQ